MKALRLRLAISFMVLLVVLAYALPNLPFIGNSPLGALVEDRINLGLDLKGGMNLTLGVDMDKALQNTLSVTGQDVRDRATQEKITIMKPRLNAEGKLEVVLPRVDTQSGQLCNSFLHFGSIFRRLSELDLYQLGAIFTKVNVVEKLRRRD